MSRWYAYVGQATGSSILLPCHPPCAAYVVRTPYHIARVLCPLATNSSLNRPSLAGACPPPVTVSFDLVTNATYSRGDGMGRHMTACLAILAVSGMLGCADMPVQVPASEVSAAVAGTDSVALTYICGNMFRVRNSSFEPRSVRWDIYNAAPADTGSVRARGRDIGSAYVDFFVTSRTKGTMRMFVGTTLVATKANGNRPACSAPVDTSRPSTIPSAGASAARIVVESPSTLSPDNVEYRRTAVNVRFNSTATGAQIREFQSRFGAQLIATYPGFFRFRIPDAGADYSTFASTLAAMALHSAVQSATPIRSFGAVKNLGSRFPNDGSGHRYNDYSSKSFSTWPARSMRLPEAWWCETGRYGGKIPRIAVYEQNFPVIAAADLTPSLLSPVVRITQWRDTMSNPPSNANKVQFENHGHFVAGMITSSGDDSVGVAGPLWRSDLRIVTLGNTDSLRGAGTLFFSAYVGPELRRAAPRILSLSSDISAHAQATMADSIERQGQFLTRF